MEEESSITYLRAESGVRGDGCCGEGYEDLCAADDGCNGFWWTKQSVGRNNRVVQGEVVE